jgi:pimeloyl-ACP methyl ester carboxylesterase
MEHGADAGNMQIAVKRVPAPHQPARGQVWFVTGGPGDSGLADLRNLSGFHDLVPDLDLVSFDHRGVGGSARLSCPDAEAADSLDGREIHADEWPACVQHVRNTYSAVLPFITVDQAAHDLHTLLEERGEGELYVWGVSYGTYLVNRYLVHHPDQVDGIVLDGVVPADWAFDEMDAGLDLVARDFLEACGADPSCGPRLDGDPVAFAQRVLNEVNDGRCGRLGLDRDLVRLLHGVFLMGGDRYADVIPALLVRIDRCKQRDRRALIHMFDTLFPEDGEAAIGEPQGASPVAQRHLAYGDLWNGGYVDTLQAVVDDAVATTEVSVSFARLADDWPAPPASPVDGVMAETDAAMLLLHGGYDPTMPLSRLQPTFEHFADKEVVPVTWAYHVTFNMGDCPQGLTAAFLSGEELDVACVDAMPHFDFDGDAALNEELFGTEDRWDGRPGCTSAAGPGWLGWLLVAFTRRRRGLPIDSGPGRLGLLQGWHGCCGSGGGDAPSGVARGGPHALLPHALRDLAAGGHRLQRSGRAEEGPTDV